jgi:hypothetical protein
MGNLVRVAEGEAAPSGMDAVHGVVHSLTPADMAKLSNMEHEYRCAGSRRQPSTGPRVCCAPITDEPVVGTHCRSSHSDMAKPCTVSAMSVAGQWSLWQACTLAAQFPASPLCPLTTGSLRTASRPASATSTCCGQVGV